LTVPGDGSPATGVDRPLLLQFDDNSLLAELFGEHDRHLARIEQELGVSLSTRGNRIAISGPAWSVDAARASLAALYERLKRGERVAASDVDAAVRLAARGVAPDESGTNKQAMSIRTRKRAILPRTPRQAEYARALLSHDLVFGLGPAGTGKTYIAVAVAVSLLIDGKVDRIVLSRPAVEAGERLGFLPGDLREKVDPYLRPLYDALYDMLPGDQVARRMETGDIEIAPLAFMRGRTLSNAFVILDEAQNTTPMQMKMFLTRLGEGSRMAVTGDPSQVDLPSGQASGLTDALSIVSGIPGIATVRFTDADVVRHELVSRIVRAYDARSSGKKGRARNDPADST
jgi:phosphate starvation-inducible protein PhoH and related proteins